MREDNKLVLLFLQRTKGENNYEKDDKDKQRKTFKDG